MPVSQRKSIKSNKKSPNVGPSKECTHQPTQEAGQTSGPEATPKFQVLQHFARRLFLLGLAAAAAYLLNKGTNDTVPFATSTEQISRRSFQVPCSEDYKNESHLWQDCIPRRCGRVVMDNLIPPSDVDKLLRIAKKGFSFGESDGGASILDLHTGALSRGRQFINIYKLPQGKNLFTKEDYEVFRRVRNALQLRLSMEFGPVPNKLYLTSPTFFSRMTAKAAKTIHDEYWHPHVDKETYQTFHYTTLLYLGTHGEDFTGGRFIYVDKNANRTVEPRKGRSSLFTSGSENVHYVEKVTSGERYAITVSFTCNKESAVTDPSMDMQKLHS